MSKRGAFNVESALAVAGVDVGAAKAALAELDERFGGEAGDIPAGALEQWVNEHFGSHQVRAFLMELGRAWEDEHAASLPEERKWERGPEARAEKARRNEQKAREKQEQANRQYARPY